ELETLSRRDGLVAVTLGAEGASLLEDGEEVARAEPPEVDVVDGTAAGDAFTACLLVSLREERAYDDALRRAGAPGAPAASRRGARSPRRRAAPGAGVERGDGAFRGPGAVAPLVPVGEEIGAETGRVDGVVPPARGAEPVARGLHALDGEGVSVRLDELHGHEL